MRGKAISQDACLLRLLLLVLQDLRIQGGREGVIGGQPKGWTQPNLQAAEGRGRSSDPEDSPTPKPCSGEHGSCLSCWVTLVPLPLKAQQALDPSATGGMTFEGPALAKRGTRDSHF